VTLRPKWSTSHPYYMKSLGSALLALLPALCLTSAVNGWAQAETNQLGFLPLHAEYSASLDSIVMTSASPNLLHI
jgi:hypothetical protein